MRFFHLLLPLLALAASVIAEPLAPPVDGGGDSREVALDNLLSERDSLEAFDKVVIDARTAGISEQSILEARFLFHVDRNEDDAIAALLPDFIKRRELFKIADSAIFSVREDWLAVIEYVQAIDALKKGDKGGFKSHITEAFWLSPRQASAFAPHIDRLRLEESMKSVTIDFETKLTDLGKGDAIALKSLMEGKKAMILHFWSPSNIDSESSIPDYLVTAEALGEAGIAMVSILPQDTPQILTDARAVIRPLGDKPPGAWLIDRREEPLAPLLRVQTLPTFILLSNKGAVLFNGGPDEDGLWEQLRALDPKIIRPDMDGGGER